MFAFRVNSLSKFTRVFKHVLKTRYCGVSADLVDTKQFFDLLSTSLGVSSGRIYVFFLNRSYSSLNHQVVERCAILCNIMQYILVCIS